MCFRKKGQKGTLIRKMSREHENLKKHNVNYLSFQCRLPGTFTEVIARNFFSKYLYNILFRKLWLNRLTEGFGLEQTFKEYPVQPSRHGQGHLSLDQVAEISVHPDLKHFQGWVIQISLSNLFQCLNTLTLKKFFLMANPNLLSFGLKA